MLRIVLRPDIPRPRQEIAGRTPPVSAFDVEDYDGSGYDQSDGDPRSEALIGPYSESVVVVFVRQSRSLCDLAELCVRSNMVSRKERKGRKDRV